MESKMPKENESFWRKLKWGWCVAAEKSFGGKVSKTAIQFVFLLVFLAFIRELCYYILYHKS